MNSSVEVSINPGGDFFGTIGSNGLLTVTLQYADGDADGERTEQIELWLNDNSALEGESEMTFAPNSGGESCQALFLLTGTCMDDTCVQNQ